MSATRTQIYFSAEQRRRVDAAASARGISMAELIRDAVDDYLAGAVDAAMALSSTFGAAPSASVPSRDDWQRG